MIKNSGKETICYQSMAAAMLRAADKNQAQHLAYFFKTGPGQYGEGDKFLGIKAPVTRSLVKKYGAAEFSEIERLLADEYHEIRLLGLLILVNRYEKAKTDADKAMIVRFYHANRQGINNWDLVDLSVYKIWGDYLLHHPEKRKELYRYAKSKRLWERRMAVVATMALIKAGEFTEILKLAVLLQNDKEDLMHKAVGWMLREVGKKDIKTLRVFLDEKAKHLPRTALRYAIERLPEKERQHYLKI